MFEIDKTARQCILSATLTNVAAVLITSMYLMCAARKGLLHLTLYQAYFPHKAVLSVHLPEEHVVHTTSSCAAYYAATDT